MRTTIVALALAISSVIPQPSLAEGRESIFKETLSLWVAASVRLDDCTFKSNSDKEIEQVVNAAADAFYPGFFSWWSRKSFRDELITTVAFARVTGHADAITKGCFGADIVEHMGREVVDQMIKDTAQDS